MVCPNCGHENSAESLFCGSCGASVAAGQDPTVVDTFSETGTPGGGAVAAAGAGAVAAGAEPWGTQPVDPVAPDPGGVYQEPTPTTAMPPTTAVPVGAAAATGAYAASGAEGDLPPGTPPGAPGDEDDGGSNRGWIIAIIVLALLLLAAVIAFFVTRDSDSTSTTSTSTSSTSSTSSSSTTTSSTSTSTTSTTRPPTTTTTAPTTTTTAPTTTTTTAPKPTITSFTVPSTVSTEQCASGTATLTLSWVTTNTKSVTIGISNPQPYQQGLPPSGSLQVPFVCANGTNTYYITAIGNDDSTTVDSKNATYDAS